MSMDHETMPNWHLGLNLAAQPLFITSWALFQLDWLSKSLFIWPIDLLAYAHSNFIKTAEMTLEKHAKMKD